MRFIALDTETTGTDPAKDRIIELHMRQVLWPLLQDLAPYNVVVDPGVPIPSAATAIHGFAAKDVVGKPSFRELAGPVQHMLEGAVIIAYNGRRFDVPLLHNELVRAGCKGLPVDQPVIDPYEIFLEDSPRTLTGAMQHYIGAEHPGAHSAAADVDAMLEVLRIQMKNHPADELLAATTNATKRPLDHGNRFHLDAKGVARFSFGKYRDQAVGAYPAYLHWMLGADFPKDVKDLAANFLANDCVGHPLFPVDALQRKTS